MRESPEFVTVFMKWSTKSVEHLGATPRSAEYSRSAEVGLDKHLMLA